MDGIDERSVKIAQTRPAASQKPAPEVGDPCKYLAQDRVRDSQIFTGVGVIATVVGGVVGNLPGAAAGAATVGTLYGGYVLDQNIRDPRASQCDFQEK